MKIAAALLASVACIGLLSACGDDDKVTITTNASAPDLSTADTDAADTDAADAPAASSADAPGTETLPSDFTVPQETIDLMIAQFEAAGMKVDKECFTALLSDEGLRELAAAGGQGTPSPELTQKFLACMSAGG
jgi:hypothetical protein